MSNITLTGTEVLNVVPIAANGQLSPITGQTTTQSIANLASLNGGVGLNYGGVNATTFSSVSTTTLANVSGLSTTVVPGTFQIDSYLSTTNNNTGGLKLSLNGGTAVASAFLADTWVYNGTTTSGENNANSITSNLFSAAVTATAVQINGSITITTGGTVQLQAAQNTSNGTSLTIVPGSYLTLTRLL